MLYFVREFINHKGEKRYTVDKRIREFGQTPFPQYKTREEAEREQATRNNWLLKVKAG